MDFNSDSAIRWLLTELWDNHSVLILLVVFYGLLCLSIWGYIFILIGDRIIQALQPPERDVRDLLQMTRDLIIKSITVGGTALAISVFVVILSLPFQRPEVEANPAVVQIVSIFPVVVIALTQLVSQFKGARTLRRYIS